MSKEQMLPVFACSIQREQNIERGSALGEVSVREVTGLSTQQRDQIPTLLTNRASKAVLFVDRAGILNSCFYL